MLLPHSTTLLCLLHLPLFVAVTNSYVQGPPGIPDILRTTSADGKTKCTKCDWTSSSGARYDLSHLCEHHYLVKMDNPKSAKIDFGICDDVDCGLQDNAMSCIYVPGNSPTISGRKLSLEQIEPHIPSRGVRLTLEEGDICAANNKQRQTVIDLKCDTSVNKMRHVQMPERAWEGEGSDVCMYYVFFTTVYACPLPANKYLRPKPVLTAVTGCVDSMPPQSTSDCPSTGGSLITIHGLDFPDGGVTHVEVLIGGSKLCEQTRLVDKWTIECSLGSGSGEELNVEAVFYMANDYRYPQGQHKIQTQLSMATISFKAPIDYRQHFNNFMELGVGGLGKQIQELYQRAFASRGVPNDVLKQLGIEHARGILLHGPPGSGKTLLARTIAKILHTQQVRLINAPEIMSKYLGESEKNLRGHFEDAERTWHMHGEASDLYVIIIDEIDAICKHRGKSDSSSAALAYDSVVNQLLTVMDGLKELPNTLVIGLTNRKELIDPALLRPGRFEIHIEIGLPDLQGRYEIFYIHTHQMQKNGMLSADVDVLELATNTSQFSGAEIAGVVRLAASYALDRKYGSVLSDLPLIVSKQDFHKAIAATKPAHTQKHEEIIDEFLQHGFINCSEVHNNIEQELDNLALSVKKSRGNVLESVLLYGPRQTGKSGLAANFAVKNDFTFVKVISPKTFASQALQGKISLLIDTFDDAFKSEYSLVVLDSLHHFLEVVTTPAVHASHELLNVLGSLLATAVTNKVVVVATVFSHDENLTKWPTGQIGLQDMFKIQHYVPLLDSSAVHNVLQSLNITNTNGSPLVVPAGLNVPLKELLRVTDCFDVTRTNEKDNLPQLIWEKCFKQYTGSVTSHSIVQ